jgi:hypothetical protein
MNDLLNECIDLKIGANINGLNLSIVAYCDDIVLLAPSSGHCQKLLETCSKYAKLWKIDFNPSKSVALTFQKGKNTDVPNFSLNCLQIPNVQNFEYLGLPIGDNEFISNYIEEKWKKVERSFYSLYGLGCKPKMASLDLIGFLYKQFCQSIFRYHLDVVFIGEKKLNEYDIRQNLLLKRAFSIKKFSRFGPMLEAVKVESIEQIYLKHKVFFLKQLRQNILCNELLVYLRENYDYFEQKNTSYTKQMNNLEKKIHINLSEYNPKTAIEMIEHLLKCSNSGLVDSVKFIVLQLKLKLLSNNDFFYLFKILNDLLKVDFYA